MANILKMLQLGPLPFFRPLEQKQKAKNDQVKAFWGANDNKVPKDWGRNRRVRRVEQQRAAQAKRRPVRAEFHHKVKKPAEVPTLNDLEVLNYYRPTPKEYGSPFGSGYAFGSKLQRRGYKRLGSGAYSTVYAKGDSKRVIKVGRGFDGWMEYIRWAHTKGYCGKWAPMVYSYKYFPGKDGAQFYVAVVERMAKSCMWCSFKEKEYLYGTLFSSGLHGCEFAVKCMEYEEPGVGSFMKDFAERFPASIYSWDINGNNMMVREDMRFALTDPLCNRPVNDNDVKERFKTRLCAA